MLSIPSQTSIYLYGKPVDLRKGCESLAYLSTDLVETFPSEAYFVFLNRKRNRIKILCYKPESLSYWFIRSRKGVFAPKQAMSSVISRFELEEILSNNFPKRLIRKQNEF